MFLLATTGMAEDARDQANCQSGWIDCSAVMETQAHVLLVVEQSNAHSRNLPDRTHDMDTHADEPAHSTPHPEVIEDTVESGVGIPDAVHSQATDQYCFPGDTILSCNPAESDDRVAESDGERCPDREPDYPRDEPTLTQDDEDTRIRPEEERQGQKSNN